MSQDTEEKDNKGVADIDISPHEETNLLKRIRAGKLEVPSHMMGFGFISENDAPKSPSTSSQGALSLLELRERSAARQAKEAQENAENKEARELKDFLKLGEKIHKEKCPPNPFLSGNGLGDLATSLGKSVSSDPEDIWSAICCLESCYSNILSLQFQFELPRGKQKPVYYSSRNLSKALTELKRSLKALSAFKERQLSGDDTSSPAETEGERQIGPPAKSDKEGPKEVKIPPPMSALKTWTETTQKEDTPMDKNLPEITHLLGYYLANKLQAKNINETSELFNLSSLKFEKLSFKPQTIRSIVSKMLEAGYFFSDDEEATRELLSRYTLRKKKLPEPDIPAPPGGTAADPESSVSAAADPATSEASVTNPNSISFEAAFQRFGASLDLFFKEGGAMDHFSMRTNIRVKDGNRFRIVVEQLNLPPAE